MRRRARSRVASCRKEETSGKIAGDKRTARGDARVKSHGIALRVRNVLLAQYEKRVEYRDGYPISRRGKLVTRGDAVAVDILRVGEIGSLGRSRNNPDDDDDDDDLIGRF